MADDIDIEEHDVMENPIIKQIFPDLSKLKKEILDYENDIQHELNSIKKSSENDLHRNINRNKVVTGIISKTRGTKPNKIISPKLKMQLVSDIKINLINIKPELLKSKKFCQSCLIYFSNTEGLSNHQLSCQNDINVRKDTSHKQVKNVNCSIEHNLGHYENNSNFVNNINEAELKKHSKINEVDVTVKIKDLEDKTNGSKLATACFHCSVIFPSRQSLIDHLYEILNNKNSKLQNIQYRNERDVIKKNYELLKSEKVKKKMNIQGKEDDIQTSDLFCCPICTYYFNVKNFYVGHLLIKHKLRKKVEIKCVDFNPRCKFCDSNYRDILSYNTHLRKYHRNEITKKQNNKLILPPNKYYRKISNARTSKCTKETNLPIINNYSKDRINKLIKNEMNEVRIMALKVILFKCLHCELHFLTSEDAKSHSKHALSIIGTWKCLKCQNTFKQNDKTLHQKQHIYSNYFSVVKVNDACPGKMYQISKSDVTFKKGIISNHHSICESQNTKQSQSSIQLGKYIMHYYFCSVCKCYLPTYVNIEVHRKSNCTRLKKHVCEFCGLTFSYKSLNFHRKLHIRYNLKLQDFTFFNLTFSSRSKQIKPKMPDFPKCVSCETHFIYKHEVMNHVCEKVNSLTCPDCKMIFTESAYTLHEQYHGYKLNENEVQSTNLLGSNNIIRKISAVMKDTSRPKYNSGDKIQYLYTCKNCDVSMNVYDEVIEHCQSHTHLNKLEVDEVHCRICNLTFMTSSFKQHKKLHLIFRKHQLKYLSFDVFNFNSNNDEWLDHLFGTVDKNTINKIIENSIYKYENRVKMEVIQNGPPALTFFKCDKCKSYASSSSIYKHIEDCNIHSEIFYCKTCDIPFVNNISKIEHEKEHFKINLSLCRIVTFNREKDKVFNENISKMKYYVLYQCRYCHVVLEKKNCFISHKCNSHKCNNCNICGLLIYERDYVKHLFKHKVFNSFNKKVMKVVLIGNKVANKHETRTNSPISKFSGMVCDYTFYKCVKCDVCIRDQRSTMRHYCLIDAAKSKCPRCGLIFDEGKLKGHLKLHDTDPDISRDTIMIQEFGYNKSNIEELCLSTNVEIEANDHLVNNLVSNADGDERTSERNDFIPIAETIVNLYKCYCGLHFINEIEIKEHIKKCSGFNKGKQSRQDCFKCGLIFTPNVLFKHLLEHHGGKTKTFKYEIIDYFNQFVPIL
ncbi:zinc finger protein 91-like [Nymphalis io]|uniref:zinc finger protein 91-like n=1 Tax=Inachis io TaxID=171585 RepID=UPI00216966A8|nr:zinc finger protein 91-like [Nymphalis io]